MTVTLADVYESLATGELTHVIMGSELDEDYSKVPKKHFVRLRNAVQLGLTDLHKRFLLREETISLDLSSGLSSYILTKEYAESNIKSSQPIKYIKDAAAPFESNLVKIARISTDLGDPVPLNLLDSDYTVNLVRSDRISIGKDVKANGLIITFHADHPQFNKYLADSSPMSVQVEIPTTFIYPLSLFVASRIINPIGLSEQFHEGNNYFSKYLSAIAEIQEQGLDIRQTSSNSRLEEDGWA